MHAITKYVRKDQGQRDKESEGRVIALISVQFSWFAKNFHHFAFKFFVDSYLKLMDYSNEITIFIITA